MNKQGGEKIPKIIFKTKYIKAINVKSRSRYIEYISTREGVVKNTSQINEKELNNNQKDKYISYIGTRPNVVKEGSHGLFGAEDNVNLDTAKNKLKDYDGNMWVHIISLTRGDAERLGYTNIQTWKNVIKANVYQMSNDMNINPNNLEWYAAFHNEKEHPHVHLVMFSKDPKEGYVNRKAIDKMRSRMANTIFKDDLITIYQSQTLLREKIKEETKNSLNEIINDLNNEDFDNKIINSKMIMLSSELREYNGKKVYGYLPKKSKKIVNDIYYELSKNEKINVLFDLWYQEKEKTILTYKDDIPERLDLVDIKDFKSIRNIIVSSANDLNIDNLCSLTVADFKVDTINVTGVKPLTIQDIATVSCLHDDEINVESLTGINQEKNNYHKTSEVYYVNPSVKLGYHLSNIIQNRIIENIAINKIDKRSTIEIAKRKEVIGHNELDSIESEMV